MAQVARLPGPSQTAGGCGGPLETGFTLLRNLLLSAASPRRRVCPQTRCRSGDRPADVSAFVRIRGSSAASIDARKGRPGQSESLSARRAWRRLSQKLSADPARRESWRDISGLTSPVHLADEFTQVAQVARLPGRRRRQEFGLYGHVRAAENTLIETSRERFKE